MSSPAPPLLTTDEVAELLHVHPKHVYRLLKKGLPARRVGSEWRFEQAEVMAWSRRGSRASPARFDEGPRLAAPSPEVAAPIPPLVAANGDRVVLVLLRVLKEAGTLVGLVQADKGEGLTLLSEGRVIAAGSHAGGFPTHVGGERVARIHLVTREIGLVSRGRLPRVRDLKVARLASRPETAGVRRYLDEALLHEGIDATEVHARARSCASHLEVACVVARGAADVGLASRAWADELGLAFRPLAQEAYGLLVRASHLGDPRIVRVCEVAQGERFREELATIAGYDASGAGEIKYDGTT